MNRRSALFVLAGAGALVSPAAEKELSPEELSKLLEKRENLFFLDVREPEEIAQLGSVKGYVNIPLAQLERRLKEVPRNKLIITA
jgi:rhodanese-related sulfurtransferase